MNKYEQRVSWPKSLLNDNGGAVTSLVSLVLLVSTVSVLNDRRRLATTTKPLLCVVATKLTLDQHGSLRHPLVVHELRQSKMQDNITAGSWKHGTTSVSWQKHTNTYWYWFTRSTYLVLVVSTQGGDSAVKFLDISLAFPAISHRGISIY